MKPILLTSAKLHAFVLKKLLKTQKKVKRNEKLCIKMQSLSAFLDITKVVDFP